MSVFVPAWQIQLPRGPSTVSVRDCGGVVLESRCLPMPSGTRPRLIFAYIASQLVASGRREIDLGRSLSEFSRFLGIDRCGKSMAETRLHLMSVAGLNIDGALVCPDFEEWADAKTPAGKAIWPSVLIVSKEFQQIVVGSAVALRPEVLQKLQSSSLAMDLYTWVAERFESKSEMSWSRFRNKIGADYKDAKSFKRVCLPSIGRLQTSWPECPLRVVRGGVVIN